MTTGWHVCWPRHRLALSCLVLSPAENSASPWLARPQKIPVQKSVRCRQVSPSCRERTRHQETVVLQGNNLDSWQDARFTSTGRKARPLGPTRVEQTRLPLSARWPSYSTSPVTSFRSATQSASSICDRLAVWIEEIRAESAMSTQLPYSSALLRKFGLQRI